MGKSSKKSAAPAAVLAAVPERKAGEKRKAKIGTEKAKKQKTTATPKEAGKKDKKLQPPKNAGCGSSEEVLLESEKELKINKAAKQGKQESGKKAMSAKKEKSTTVMSEKVAPEPKEAGKKAEKQMLLKNDESRRKEPAKKRVAKALVAKNGLNKSNQESSDLEEDDEVLANTPDKPGSFNKPGSSFSVLIQGFDPSLSVEQLRSSLKGHFSKCGKVTGVSVSAIEGKAYVSFVDVSCVIKAICLGGRDLGGYNLYVAETDLDDL